MTNQSDISLDNSDMINESTSEAMGNSRIDIDIPPEFLERFKRLYNLHKSVIQNKKHLEALKLHFYNDIPPTFISDHTIEPSDDLADELDTLWYDIQREAGKKLTSVRMAHHSNQIHALEQEVGVIECEFDTLDNKTEITQAVTKLARKYIDKKAHKSVTKALKEISSSTDASIVFPPGMTKLKPPKARRHSRTSKLRVPMDTKLHQTSVDNNNHFIKPVNSIKKVRFESPSYTDISKNATSSWN